MKTVGYDEEIFRGITKVALAVQKTIFLEHYYKSDIGGTGNHFFGALLK